MYFQPVAFGTGCTSLGQSPRLVHPVIKATAKKIDQRDYTYSTVQQRTKTKELSRPVMRSGEKSKMTERKDFGLLLYLLLYCTVRYCSHSLENLCQLVTTATYSTVEHPQANTKKKTRSSST
jgi:hypothetical protein